MRILVRFAFFSIVLLSSFTCGTEEEEPVVIDNSFNYDGTKYEINDMVLRYNGLSDLTYHDSISENTHHVFDLFFTDGTVEFDCFEGCYGNAIGVDATYFISVRFATVAANHTKEFPAQTFQAIDPNIFNSGNSPIDEDFFTTFFYRIDEGDGQFNPSDIFIDASSGTIKFEKSLDEYVVILNTIDTNSAKNLLIKGSYTGPIEKVDY